MHIVYISREYPPALRMGGIASYVKEIAEIMSKRGHNVTVISASDDTRKECREEINGVTVFRLKGGDFVLPQMEPTTFGLKKFRTIYRFKSYRQRINKIIQSLPKVDIIEVPEYGAEGYYLDELKIPVSLRLHTPTLLDRDSLAVKKCTLRTFHDYWVGRRELEVIRNAKHITSCSKSLADWCISNVNGVTDDIEVIFNPLNISKWEWIPILEYKENSVFYAGTVAEAKGVGDLVEAIAKMQSPEREISLTIAGKLGEYGRCLQQMCEHKNYTWVTFLGHITRDELVRHYQSSKISCFPSWWDNLPMVCIEAMTSGNVVIGSSNGGMSEIITHGIDGLLVEPQNQSQLIKIIESGLAMSQSQVHDMRQEAYRKITTKFSGEVIASQLENQYRKAIERYEKSIVD